MEAVRAARRRRSSTSTTCGQGGRRAPRWSPSCSPTTRRASSSRWPRWSRLAHEQGALVHCDAVQAAGKIPVDVRALDVDLLALSGAQDLRPQGRGRALRASAARASGRWLRGGSQERNRRAGTENVAGIVGLGRAAALAREELAAESARLAALRDRLEARLLAIPGAQPQRRRPARAEHHQRLLRGHRGGEPAHGPRPHGRRRLHRRGLRRRRGRAFARAARDGPAAGAGAGLPALLAGPRHHRETQVDRAAELVAERRGDAKRRAVPAAR